VTRAALIVYYSAIDGDIILIAVYPVERTNDRAVITRLLITINVIPRFN